MNRIRLISVLGLLLCGMAAVSAQTYEQILRGNFWNTSGNVTGIRQDTVSRSYAELSGSYEGGGFRDTWQAPRGWSAGASTASIQHLEKMSLKGSFAFTQTEGYGMCGSMFIKPGYYPVDVLEFTPGRKTLQTYAFDGGISYDLGTNWRIGAMMDFESANMAKRKDLRHSNWRLDMTVSPGFMFHDGDFAIGANYIFRKTSETVEAKQVGISETSYYAFLDKGLMYGVHNIWTGSGLHLDEDGVKGFPVKDFSHGAAVQMQYKGLFAEVEYLHTSGTIGEKEFIWFLFPGNSVDVRLGYRHEGHFARLDFGWKAGALDETVLEKVTVGGVTTVVGHGHNRIQTHSGWSLKPEYEYVSEKVEVLASAHVNSQMETASQMYPYVSAQSLMKYGADVRVKTYIGPFDLAVKAGYAGGMMNEESWLTDDATGVQTSPYRLQEWYDRQMEYETAARMSVGLSLRWNFWKGLYTEAEATWLHGVNLKYISSPNRYGATLKLGINM